MAKQALGFDSEEEGAGESPELGTDNEINKYTKCVQIENIKIKLEQDMKNQLQ